jgi:hypothetical protein
MTMQKKIALEKMEVTKRPPLEVAAVKKPPASKLIADYLELLRSVSERAMLIAQIQTILLIFLSIVVLFRVGWFIKDLFHAGRFTIHKINIFCHLCQRRTRILSYLDQPDECTLFCHSDRNF